MDNNILNNAALVLGQLETEENKEVDEKVLRLVPVSSFNNIKIDDNNIENNSKFICDLFD